MQCNGGTCQEVTCDPGVSCLYCLDSNGSETGITNMKSCGYFNFTRSIKCVGSSSECTFTGGQLPSEPIISSASAASQSATIEDLFMQLLTLLYWIMAVVILFFVVALFISGLHLAYGLVKR